MMASRTLSQLRERKSRGDLPVAFRNARAKFAGVEYPNAAETWTIEPSVWRSNSLAR
jgi:hypothetical protein